MRTSVQGWCYHSFERWATYQGWNVLDKQNVEKLKMQKRIECAKVWSFFLAAIATLYLHRYLSDWFMIINLSHRPMSRRYLTFLTKTLESWEQISSHFRISNDPPLPDFPHETSQVLRTLGHIVTKVIIVMIIIRDKMVIMVKRVIMVKIKIVVKDRQIYSSKQLSSTSPTSLIREALKKQIVFFIYE